MNVFYLHVSDKNCSLLEYFRTISERSFIRFIPSHLKTIVRQTYKQENDFAQSCDVTIKEIYQKIVLSNTVFQKIQIQSVRCELT